MMPSIALALLDRDGMRLADEVALRRKCLGESIPIVSSGNPHFAANNTIEKAPLKGNGAELPAKFGCLRGRGFQFPAYGRPFSSRLCDTVRLCP